MASKKSSRRNLPAPLPGLTQEAALARCALRRDGHLKIAYILRHHPSRGGDCHSVQEAMRTGEIPFEIFENGVKVVETELERFARLAIFAVLYYPGVYIPFKFALPWVQGVRVDKAKDDRKRDIEYFRYNSTKFRKYIEALGIAGLSILVQREKECKGSLDLVHGLRLTSTPEEYQIWLRKETIRLSAHGSRTLDHARPDKIRPSDLRSAEGQQRLADLIKVLSTNFALSAQEQALLLQGK